MAKNTMIAALVEAHKSFNAALTAAKQETTQELAEHVAEALPPGFRLEWRQYAPYFNDGDPCTFSVNTAAVVPVKVAPEPELDEDGDPVEPDDEDDSFGEDREDSVSLSAYTLKTYGAVFHEEGTRLEYDWVPNENGRGQRRVDKPNTPYVIHMEAEPELPGLPRAAVLALAETWDAIPEDVMKSAFGDDAECTITRALDGSVTYTTEHYDHD